MPILITAKAGSLLPLQVTELLSSRICRKIISRECEKAFFYQFFAAGFPCKYIDKLHILAYANETSFCDLKGKFPLHLKVKCQWFDVKLRPVDLYHF
jgi:hypothetical protein